LTVKPVKIVTENTPAGQAQSLALSYVPYLTAPDIESVSVTLYADLLKVKVHYRKLPGDEKRAHYSSQNPRGLITDFTPRSRKRFLEKFAMKKEYIRPLFFTPTYPDEIFFQQHLTMRDVQGHYEAFRKRLERFSNEVGGAWRIELEIRKSGDFIGHVAPHFHFVIDGLLHDLSYLRKLFRQWWTEIIGAQNLDKRVRIDLQPVKSKKHLYYYVSKYTAKTRPIDSELDYDTGELKVRSFLLNHAGDFGRHWGTFGNWNTTPYMVAHMHIDDLKHIRRMAAGWLKSRNRKFSSFIKNWHGDLGFTIFGLGATSSKAWDSFFDSTATRMIMIATRAPPKIAI
jgi:hypothetical protein